MFFCECATVSLPSIAFGVRESGVVDLLKRLSKTQKTVFSGRILTFLAQLFPLNEKSGLNQIGHFNTENVTKLTKTKAASTPTEEPEVNTNDPAMTSLVIELLVFLEGEKDGRRRRW